MVGSWNEASDDLHTLVHTIAKARLRHEEELEGRGRRRSDSAALSILTGQVRRTLSLVSAQATARCLLDRVQVLGSGGREASRRRRWVEEEESRMQRVQRAHILSLQHGRAVHRRGEFYLLD